MTPLNEKDASLSLLPLNTKPVPTPASGPPSVDVVVFSLNIPELVFSRPLQADVDLSNEKAGPEVGTPFAIKEGVGAAFVNV